ncbi:hypothetical protein SBDP2_130005 [Syntrophobacter sp. SbD2]|nr:hypothetical protein SBDP2_130005 [Syntrophobacter sp. SbD2]
MSHTSISTGASYLNKNILKSGM